MVRAEEDSEGGRKGSGVCCKKAGCEGVCAVHPGARATPLKRSCDAWGGVRSGQGGGPESTGVRVQLKGLGQRQCGGGHMHEHVVRVYPWAWQRIQTPRDVGCPEGKGKGRAELLLAGWPGGSEVCAALVAREGVPPQQELFGCYDGSLGKGDALEPTPYCQRVVE
mmetsp:Transcript_19304/g.33190  ORF Transcript_19304/g.33190 Transcript_19304/m.33190 type:complete len:166 (+) Transcript_19304:33-530(+)